MSIRNTIATVFTAVASLVGVGVIAVPVSANPLACPNGMYCTDSDTFPWANFPSNFILTDVSFHRHNTAGTQITMDRVVPKDYGIGQLTRDHCIFTVDAREMRDPNQPYGPYVSKDFGGPWPCSEVHNFGPVLTVSNGLLVVTYQTPQGTVSHGLRVSDLCGASGCTSHP